MASLITKVAVVATAATLLTLTGCSSDSGSSGDSGAASENADGRGPITYVEGQDTTETGVVQQIISEWNAANPDQQVTFKEQSADADQAHDDFVQQLQAQQSDYDVMALDVVWTAEFAAKGWLVPLEGEFALDNAGVLPATVASATYNGKQYAAPKNTNGGLLYYRSDLLPEAPTTWAELTEDCQVARDNNIDCYAGQFAPYEGLTANASEIINAHGGSIVGEDGKTPTVNSPEAKAGLQTLVTAFETGVIPAQDTTFKESDSQQAFQDGKTLFLRNWPYVYGTAAEKVRLWSESTRSHRFPASPEWAPRRSADTTPRSARTPRTRQLLPTSCASCRARRRSASSPRVLCRPCSPRCTTIPH